MLIFFFFFFSSRRRHTRFSRDWSSDVCSSDLVCFSNAGTGNPWRVTGLTTIKAEAKLHPEIGELTIVDAASKDDKQISDLADLQTKKCDALIVSPNTTTALTPAVE